MRIIKKHIDFKQKIFNVTVMIEEHTDDNWNLYNLMSEGDFVYGKCFRKVQKQENISGGLKNVRKTLTLLLKIRSFDYDPDSDILRVQGLNASENQFCGMGLYQGMDIKSPMKISLIKRNFDYMHVKKLREITSESAQGQILAIVMEESMANIFLVSKTTTKLKAKIESSISKNVQYGKKDESLKKFYGKIISALNVHFAPDNKDGHGSKELLKAIKAVVVGSPGFYKDKFYEHLNKTAEHTKSVMLKDFMGKVILTHTSSGFKQALNQILENKQVQESIAGLSCFSEQKYLDEFFEVLRTKDDHCTYGKKAVIACLDQNAVKVMLISDNLFRSKNLQTRKDYVNLVQDAEKNGVNVVICGSQNPAGTRLKDMTGIAAILHYAIQFPDFSDDEDSDDSDEENNNRFLSQSKKKKSEVTVDEEEVEELLGGLGLATDDQESLDLMFDQNQDYKRKQNLL